MKKKTGSIVSSLMLKLGIVVAILLVGAYLKVRLDFSKNNAYSLSKVSKDAVRNLEDIMLVKILASQELPAELNSLSRYVNDLLSEYQVAGRGKFRFEYVRATGKEELYSLARENGLSIMRFQSYENDQVVTKEVIFGLVFEHLGKFDSMNLLPKVEPKLEYELTQRIQKLSGYALPKISVFRDSTYYDFQTTLFDNALATNFRPSTVDLQSPLSDAPVLLFTGVARNISELQLYHLDQYIMNGGKVVFLQDGVDTDSKQLFKINSNVIDLLQHYGVSITSNVAMDIECDIRRSGLVNVLRFPMYPVVKGGEHPITRNVYNIVLYLPSGVLPVNKDGVVYESILSTSGFSSWLEAPNYELDPIMFSDSSPNHYKVNSINVGATLKGEFRSYFTDSELASHPKFKAKSPKTELVIFGDKELVIDPDKQEYAERNYVVLNALDYLIGRNDLISIRSRHLSSSSLNIRNFMQKNDLMWGNQDRTEKRIKNAIKGGAIAIPPLVLICIGILIAIKRKYIEKDIA